MGEYNWNPETIDSLYVDEDDFHGLIYWYEEIKRKVKEIKKTK